MDKISENKDDFLSQDEINRWQPEPEPCKHHNHRTSLKNAIQLANIDTPFQVAGHHFAIGCVALEITQRCNLDCTACYLSDFSEAVRDVPLEEIYRRIDLISKHYGPNTNVQVTGGDPTLRKRDELIAIIKRLSEQKLRPALFTNGIKASRGLLKDLKEAGLKDIAFHVDMTQERKGYDSEKALNKIRQDYIDQARGLGLQIIFNTTVFKGNIDDIPELVNFFAERAKDIHLASFQMIADTGRGIERDRTQSITQKGVMDLICQGVGTDISFDFPQIGHLECNRYCKILVAGKKRVSAFTEEDKSFFEKLMPLARKHFLNRHKPFSSLLRFLKHIITHDFALVGQMAQYAFRKVSALGKGLLQAKEKPHLITFYIHNFMHENALKKERCETCVFMTMTKDGPVSMCVHNAKRDHFILQNITLKNGEKWEPLEGQSEHSSKTLPFKRLKGRERVSRKANRITGRIGEIAMRQERERKLLEKEDS